VSLDLTSIFRDWPYEPGRLNVRLIKGDDGEPKVQVRLDLGLLQMNAEGRPDGERPHGFESLLEYHESRLDALERGDSRESDERGEDPSSLELTPEECKALRDEAAQYYHRYVALLVLEDFEGVIRDTTRNLRLLDFCAAHAREEDDRTVLEQVRPYITMMRARAMASQALRDNEHQAAVLAVDDGLAALRDHYAARGEPEAFEDSNEVQMLRTMRETLVPKLPVSQTAELRERLQEALQNENYELAAILRDELRMISKPG